MTHIKLLRLWSGISHLALLAATAGLWLPSVTIEPNAPNGVPSAFPQIPLLDVFCGWSIVIDWIATATMVIGWICLAGFGRVRSGAALVLISGALLVLLNQHRLQPWHWQLMVFAMLFTIRDSNLQLAAIRAFLVSVYLYSALSKFDFEFLHTVGQQFVDQVEETLFGVLEWSDTSNLWLAGLIPVIELAIAIGLAFKTSRRIAGIGAVLLHLGLLWLLGPFGLNHSVGVLFWNVHFIGAAILVFVLQEPIQAGTHDDADTPETPNATPRRSGQLQLVVLSIILLLPAGERFGLWDHWLSWALYAPHSSRVEVDVASTAVDRLPNSLQTLIPEFEETDLWVRLPLERWSFATLAAPIYPQDRFQLGVARALAANVDSPFEIRVRLLGVASRLDGERQTTTLTGTAAIEKAAESFRLNTRPRF